jgi:hypothetical protein
MRVLFKRLNEASESPRQRWAHVFTIIIGILVFTIGLNVRNSALTATTVYENLQAGILAYYPYGWLLDTQGGEEYVFRVRDMTRGGFKTTIQISVQPVSDETTPRSIADRLAFRRARTYTDYNVLSTEDYALRTDLTAQAVSYTYTTRETSAFLQGIPDVVRGQDLLTISRGQALIITFRAEASVYESEYRRFRQFLRQLSF